MFSATFKVINNIRNEICSISAQAIRCEAWSDNFARSEIREVVFNEPSSMRRKADTIILDAHLQDMSGLELHESGFREWDHTMVPGLFLIPLYLVGYMDPYMAVTDIYGNRLRWVTWITRNATASSLLALFTRPRISASFRRNYKEAP